MQMWKWTFVRALRKIESSNLRALHFHIFTFPHFHIFERYFCAVRRKKKDIILEKIEVEDYAAEGKSLARVDGKVIFIENVVPGDIVDVQLLKNKKDWAEGRPLRFHGYSPQRVQPFCAHFGVCGGCQWQ